MKKRIIAIPCLLVISTIFITACDKPNEPSNWTCRPQAIEDLAKNMSSKNGPEGLKAAGEFTKKCNELNLGKWNPEYQDLASAKRSCSIDFALEKISKKEKSKCIADANEKIDALYKKWEKE